MRRNAVSAELQPLVSERRSDGVVERLRTLILTGAYPPGSRLPNERELSEALAVNRGSVREGLKQLEFLELIEVRHGQGSFVCELAGSSALQLIEALLRDRRTITADLLRQILEFRRHMTIHAAELAAANRSPEVVERARALIERETREGRDPRAALEIDVEMNSLLGEATGNLVYQFLTNLFTRLLRQLGPLYYNERRDFARSLRTHRELLLAIEAGEPAAARRILEQMLDYSQTAIMAEVERLESEGLIGPDARGAVT
jgi:GntR family transcriptional repressor for pyruvate dehydrogenase complex